MYRPRGGGRRGRGGRRRGDADALAGGGGGGGALEGTADGTCCGGIDSTALIAASPETLLALNSRISPVQSFVMNFISVLLTGLFISRTFQG